MLNTPTGLPIKPNEAERLQALYQKASDHIERARQTVQRSVNTEMVKAYWLIGRDIVEDEQTGLVRASYGKSILKDLSQKLVQSYKRGFSVDTLERARKFYLTYQAQISAAPLRKSNKSLAAPTSTPDLSPNLSWGHYLLLIRVKRPEARQFYEIEAIKNCWSSRELQRQIASLLYDRLAKSKDAKGLMALACKGQEINRPEDAIKDPLILEFLSLPDSHQLLESKLEHALIQNLQQFLLELGKGFAFVARQKRLTLEGDHFYADLVMYNIHLKCYVILDIKTRALTHGDIGQMQLYVNYFDQEVRISSDNPTIGLVLCTEKNDAVVKYTLGENSKQIFASTYQFQLPTEKELEEELKREIKEIKHQLKLEDPISHEDEI